MRSNRWKRFLLSLPVSFVASTVWASDQPATTAPCYPQPACRDFPTTSPDEVFSQPGIPPSPVTPAPSPLAPAPESMASPSFGSLGAGQGALTAQADVPAFLGDFFGGPGLTGSSPVFAGTSRNGPIFAGAGTQHYGYLGGNAGVLKIAEGTSPLPRDRAFVGYSFYDNVSLTNNGVNVNRLTPGLEKTFLNGDASVEVRVPMAWTLGSTITDSNGSAGGPFANTDEYELGNLTVFTKFLLLQSDTFALSAGLGIGIPTADDIRLVDGGFTRLQVDNDAVHLLPFIGAVYTPNDDWFGQGLFQIDVATRGNDVFVDGTNAGRLNDATFLFLSLGAGRWIYRSEAAGSWLTGVAPFMELHLNQGLQDSDYVTSTTPTAGTTLIGSPGAGRVSTLNTVLGLTSQLGDDKSLTVGYVLPVAGGDDEAFDGEFRLLFNWYFGGQLNRLSRVQF